MRTEIAEPLGVEGLHIGVDETAREFIAEPVGSALRHLGAASRYITPVLTGIEGTRAAHDALIAPGFHQLFEGSEPSIWNTEMPAVNGALSADALARMYGTLANGGADPRRPPPLRDPTVRDLGRVHVPHLGHGPRHAHAVAARLPPRLRHRPAGVAGVRGTTGTADPVDGLTRTSACRSASSRNRIGSITTPMADLTLYRLSRVVRDCAVRRLNAR